MPVRANESGVVDKKRERFTHYICMGNHTYLNRPSRSTIVYYWDCALGPVSSLHAAR